MGWRDRPEFDDRSSGSFARDFEPSFCRVSTALGSRFVLLVFIGLSLMWPVSASQAGETPGDTLGTPVAVTFSRTPDQPVEVVVTAVRSSLIGTASTASEGVVADDQLSLTPAAFPMNRPRESLMCIFIRWSRGPCVSP